MIHYHGYFLFCGSKIGGGEDGNDRRIMMGKKRGIKNQRSPAAKHMKQLFMAVIRQLNCGADLNRTVPK